MSLVIRPSRSRSGTQGFFKVWKPHWHDVDELQLLFRGLEFFPALRRAIDDARFEVLLETYIFAADDVGLGIAASLIDAARRGVQIRLVVDWIGTPVIPRRADMEAAGVQIEIFNPHWFSSQGFTRTHRKIAVIDRQRAFVGGINLIDDHDNYRNGRLPVPRWDFAAQVDGEVVEDVRHAFDQQWRRLRQDYRGTAHDFVRWLEREGREQERAASTPAIAFVARDNLRERRTIENAYLHALHHARHEVWLANPYFVPGWRLRRALVQAAQRGVQVTLLLGKNEFLFLDLAVPSLYGRFLRNGVRIGEYDRTHLHGKVAVVDDEWATVGSSNFDALSFFLNHEANLLIRNHPLIGELKTHIRSVFEVEAVQIDPAFYANRSWFKRLVNWCAYQIYRLAMKLLTIGQYR